MSLPGKNSLCLLLLVIVLFLGVPSSVEGTDLNVVDCPSDISATRSSKVYWTPPTVTNTNNVGFSLIGDQQPGRYYFETTTVTYTGKDSRETAVCSFDITIQDNGSPVITSCPSDRTIMVSASEIQTAVTWTEPTVQNSANVRVTPDKSSGSNFGLGRNTVTYTFTFTNNAAAMSSFCSFDIFVEQGGSTSSPSIRCPDPITRTLGVGQDSVAVTWEDPIYQDNLGSVMVICARNKNDHFFEGRNDISCVAYFEDGQTSTCDFYVNILAPTDSQNPSIIDCPMDTTVYVAPDASGGIAMWTEPTINDDTQQNLRLVSSHTNGIFYNIGSYSITYTGTDNSGKSVTCSFRLSVEADNSSPTIVGCSDLAPTLEFYVRASETSGTVTWDEPTATDNSNVTLVGPVGNLVNGGMMNVGETRSIYYEATDTFGNSQRCDFTVTLSVDQVPQYTGCSMDRTVPTNPRASFTNVTWPEPRVTDDRSTNSLILTKTYEPGMNYQIGVYVVEYTATDEVGNVGICSFVITVADRESPRISLCPSSQTLVLGQSEISKDVTWTNPTATDNSCEAASNCDTAITITSSRNPGLFTVGDFNITITAEDASRNTATCLFLISILPYTPDTTMPVWTGCPPSVSMNTNSQQPTYNHSWTAPVVSDERGIIFEFSSHTSPFAFPIGTTTVTYRARDAANNEGLCTFDVTVRDVEPPIFTADSPCGTNVQYYVLQSRTANLLLRIPTPSATDNSGVTPAITNSHSNQTATTTTYSFPIGNTGIQFRATDTSGNVRAGCTVNVNIERTTNIWSLRGTVSLTHIRGIATTGTTTSQQLSELTNDIDQLFRRSTIGSHFVGVSSVSSSVVSGNAQVTFRLYFSKERQGRHTSRQITQAFYAALSNSLTFATNNVVVANSLTFNVREFKITSTITRLGASVNPVFVSAYDNPTSAIYINLENQIYTEFDATYTNNLGYQVSVLVDLRDGSIVNDVVMVYDGTSQTTEQNIANQFVGQLSPTTNQFRTSQLYFDRNQVPVQELCPVGECQNGGSCTYDATYTNMCTCTTGFSGDNCETEDSTGTALSAAVIAAIIGGGILLLLLLFAIFCCCLYFLYQPGDPYKEDLYPLERRPFHIIDEEASAMSSDIIMMPREVYRPPPPIVALPPPAPILALPPAPPPEPPTLHLNEYYYPSEEELFPLDPYSMSPAPTFTPDGEVYVTGPNQVAIRPSTKRGYYGY